MGKQAWQGEHGKQPDRQALRRARKPSESGLLGGSRHYPRVVLVMWTNEASSVLSGSLPLFFLASKHKG